MIRLGQISNQPDYGAAGLTAALAMFIPPPRRHRRRHMARPAGQA